MGHKVARVRGLPWGIDTFHSRPHRVNVWRKGKRIEVLYLIGGVSRSGKTSVAIEINQQTGIPIFPLDVVMSASISDGNPHKVDYKKDSDIIAKQMWSLTSSFLTELSRYSFDYILEGVTLWPSLIQTLDDKLKGYKICFLGYDTDDPDAKLNKLRSGSSTPNSWHNSFDDRTLIKLIQTQIKISKRLKNECEIRNYAYFDSGSMDLPTLSQRVMSYFDLH